MMAREEEIEEKVRKVLEIIDRSSRRPRESDLTDDEILGYDENGIPSPSGDFSLTDLKVVRLR